MFDVKAGRDGSGEGLDQGSSQAETCLSQQTHASSSFFKRHSPILPGKYLHELVN